MTKLHRLQRFRMTKFHRLRRFRVTKLQIACRDGLLANSFSRLTTRIENSKSIPLMDKSSYSLLSASWTLVTSPDAALGGSYRRSGQLYKVAGSSLQNCFLYPPESPQESRLKKPKEREKPCW